MFNKGDMFKNATFEIYWNPQNGILAVPDLESMIPFVGAWLVRMDAICFNSERSREFTLVGEHIQVIKLGPLRCITVNPKKATNLIGWTNMSLGQVSWPKWPLVSLTNALEEDILGSHHFWKPPCAYLCCLAWKLPTFPNFEGVHFESVKVGNLGIGAEV